MNVYLLGGVSVFFLVLRALKAFAEANPAALARGAALLAGSCRGASTW
jgi:hypothetical protein